MRGCAGTPPVICVLMTVISLSMFVGEGAVEAQDDSAIRHSNGSPRENRDPFKLHYGKPSTYISGSKRSLLVSDFKCGSNGTVFYLIIEDTGILSQESNQIDVGNGNGSQSLTLTGLTLSGQVVRFSHEGIPGLRNFVSEARYFVSNSRVYALELADEFDPANPQKVLGRSYLIIIYDYKGVFQKYVRLEPGIEPLNIAAFDSGDIAVISQDKWNHTAHVLILDSAGRQQNDLPLFGDDYHSRADLASGEIPNLPRLGDDNTLYSLLALGHLMPLGDDLLFEFDKSQLPILEINERGLVRSTRLALPEGVVVGGLLPASGTTLRVPAGHLSYWDARGITQTSDADTKQHALLKIDEIYEFNRLDGSLTRQIQFADKLIPVCGQDDTYTFATSREEDGRIQLIRGDIIH